VFELESGDQFFCWANYVRILNRAWGYNSDDWLNQELELSLGHYTDRKTDPPTEKETTVVRPLSPRKAEAQNAGTLVSKPLPPSKTAPAADGRAMDDEIPF
jgi:hypothetical protein